MLWIKPVHFLIISFSCFFLFPYEASAAAKQYAGHGISFSYPERYTLSESTQKSAKVVRLKAGWDVIEVRILHNPLFDGYVQAILKAVKQQFDLIGYGIRDETREQKEIPLQVKGESSPVSVKSVKVNQIIEVVEEDVHLDLHHTMFFFSYGNQGYLVDYRRATGKYGDLVEVLSSLTFDEKEKTEDMEKNSQY